MIVHCTERGSLRALVEPPRSSRMSRVEERRATTRGVPVGWAGLVGRVVRRVWYEFPTGGWARL